MDSEKKEFARWWLWVLLLVVLSALVFGGLHYAGVLGHTVVEREVFENSYQRSAGTKQQIATFEAELARLRARLNNPNLSEGTRAEIEAQIAAIEIQLDAARRRQ